MILRPRFVLLLLIGLLLLASVPVGAQPSDLRPITADNLNQLQVIETFGFGPLLELPRSVLPIHFSPDGSLLAAVNDRFEIEIWATAGN